ncbi:MAG: hypothetical protein O8C63_04070 [Candidatus Methanoperedens sp.]|nr:hypothetical protein [Candidatus Methanoperedens sp.]
MSTRLSQMPGALGKRLFGFGRPSGIVSGKLTLGLVNTSYSMPDSSTASSAERTLAGVMLNPFLITFPALQSSVPRLVCDTTFFPPDKIPASRIAVLVFAFVPVISTSVLFFRLYPDKICPTAS